MQSNIVEQLQSLIATQHQMIVQQQQHVAEAQNAKLDVIFNTVMKLQNDMAEFMAANRSSSSSGTRYSCPMNCGSSFKKVCCWF
jgi:hypothetical protein